MKRQMRLGGRKVGQVPDEERHFAGQEGRSSRVCTKFLVLGTYYWTI